jgi:hypothetical protein
MESALIRIVSKLRSAPLLIDPKAELKIQKEAGNTETLVDYARIVQVADKAKALHLMYLLDQDEEISNSKGSDMFDMQGL